MVSAVRRVSNPVDAANLMGRVLQDAALSSFTAADVSGGNATLTSAQLLGGAIFRTGTAPTDTTDTAANLIAAMGNPPDGTCRLIVIRNACTGTLTLSAGTGVTITGTATVATVTTALYMLRKTGATTVSLTRLIAAAY